MPVEVPEKFEFPFEPYDIQQGFMRQLYTCLEQGRIGIFESPTGTVSIRMQQTNFLSNLVSILSIQLKHKFK